MKKKVVFIPGEAFFANQGPKHYMRLSYSSVNEEKITEGVKRLGELLKKYY